MKVLAFSDLHRDRAAADALLEAAEEADLVIGAGDFASLHEGLEETMGWLAPIAHKAIYVPGNNETEEALAASTEAKVLHGGACFIGTVQITGIGAAVPPLPTPSWPSFDISEEMAETMLAGFKNTDILVTHSPPHGVCDRHTSLGSIGSTAIRAAIERMKPKLVLCGHVHDDWGSRGMVGPAIVCNLGPRSNWFEVA